MHTEGGREVQAAKGDAFCLIQLPTPFLELEPIEGGLGPGREEWPSDYKSVEVFLHRFESCNLAPLSIRWIFWNE